MLLVFVFPGSLTHDCGFDGERPSGTGACISAGWNRDFATSLEVVVTIEIAGIALDDVADTAATAGRLNVPIGRCRADIPAAARSAVRGRFERVDLAAILGFTIAISEAQNAFGNPALVNVIAIGLGVRQPAWGAAGPPASVLW